MSFDLSEIEEMFSELQAFDFGDKSISFIRRGESKKTYEQLKPYMKRYLASEKGKETRRRNDRDYRSRIKMLSPEEQERRRLLKRQSEARCRLAKKSCSNEAKDKP